MTEPAPFNTPSLVLHLRDGSRIVAEPETVLQLRYRNKRGPVVGLSDLRKIELRLDENEPAGSPRAARWWLLRRGCPARVSRESRSGS